jgi:signal transduction histidine kinase
MRDWTGLISGLTDDLAGGFRRLVATLEGMDSAARARVAGERDYIADSLETLRANVAMAKEIAFPLSHYLLGRTTTLDLEPVDVNVLLRQVARTLRPRARQELHVAETQAPLVMADRALLFRVLLNLAENALEALREADPEATVTVRAEVAPDEGFLGGRCLAIRVVDTGAGMAPDLLARLMAGETLTTHPQGSGMGLAIARDIIGRHGGSLDLESEEGKGTTATVKLPLAQ